MKSSGKFEQQIKQKADGFELIPEAQAWFYVQQNIAANSERTGLFLWMWVLLAVALLAPLGIGFYLDPNIQPQRTAGRPIGQDAPIFVSLKPLSDTIQHKTDALSGSNAPVPENQDANRATNWRRTDNGTEKLPQNLARLHAVQIQNEGLVDEVENAGLQLIAKQPRIESQKIRQESVLPMYDQATRTSGLLPTDTLCRQTVEPLIGCDHIQASDFFTQSRMKEPENVPLPPSQAIRFSPNFKAPPASALPRTIVAMPGAKAPKAKGIAVYFGGGLSYQAAHFGQFAVNKKAMEIVLADYSSTTNRQLLIDKTESNRPGFWWNVGAMKLLNSRSKLQVEGGIGMGMRHWREIVTRIQKNFSLEIGTVSTTELGQSAFRYSMLFAELPIEMKWPLKRFSNSDLQLQWGINNQVNLYLIAKEQVRLTATNGNFTGSPNKNLPYVVYLPQMRMGVSVQTKVRSKSVLWVPMVQYSLRKPFKHNSTGLLNWQLQTRIKF